MKTTLMIISFLCIVNALGAQEYQRTDINPQYLSDKLLALQDDDVNYEELYENLMQLQASPIDLNKASSEDLRRVFILTESQINNLLHHREANGNFLSIYELQSVDGFDLETIYNIVPFLIVTDPNTRLDKSFAARIRSDGDHYLMFRYDQSLQKKKGFLDEDSSDRFKGSRGHMYCRFRSSRPGDFSFGFTLEKDEGEKFKWNPAKGQIGFDYFSFHAQVQNKGWIKNLVIGDYQLQFGQGVALGGSFGMGKGGETITTVRRCNIGISPYTSLFESGGLRGVAASFNAAKNTTISIFGSINNRDANIDSMQRATSFLNTGLHRNEKEIASRHSLKEENAGAVVQYRFRSLEVGLTAHYIHYSNPTAHALTPYNQFAFSGSSNCNVSAFINYTFKNVTTFGEVVQSMNGGKAIVAGLITSLHPKFDLSILLRHYEKDFHSFYTNAFSENTTPQNERGIYWGTKYRFSRRFSISSYTDFFSFPWIKYRNYTPSTGHEWLFRCDYAPTRKVLVFFQWREEMKSRNKGDDQTLYLTGYGKKINYTFSSDFGIGQKLRFKTRAQFSRFTFDGRTTHGGAIIQDLSFEAGRFQFSVRHALFDTDDYDNRQYAYEPDVWLAYSLPAYFGKGIRQGLLIEYKINRHVSIWMRLTRTRYVQQTEIGSGPELIHGDEKSDIKFQARWRL